MGCWLVGSCFLMFSFERNNSGCIPFRPISLIRENSLLGWGLGTVVSGPADCSPSADASHLQEPKTSSNHRVLATII
jgi:hypothetical protein